MLRERIGGDDVFTHARERRLEDQGTRPKALRHAFT